MIILQNKPKKSRNLTITDLTPGTPPLLTTEWGGKKHRHIGKKISWASNQRIRRWRPFLAAPGHGCTSHYTTQNKEPTWKQRGKITQREREGTNVFLLALKQARDYRGGKKKKKKNFDNLISCPRTSLIIVAKGHWRDWIHLGEKYHPFPPKSKCCSEHVPLKAAHFLSLTEKKTSGLHVVYIQRVLFVNI